MWGHVWRKRIRVYLYCNRDLTKLWSNSLVTNLGPCSTPCSSPSLKNNSKPTARNCWRLRWQLQKELNRLRDPPIEQGLPPLPLPHQPLTLAPLSWPGNPLLPTPSPPIPPPRLVSPYLPRLPNSLTPFLDPLVPPSPGSPSGNNTIEITSLLRGAEAASPAKELPDLAPDMLYSLEAWRWLWNLELRLNLLSYPIPLSSPSSASATNANLPTMSDPISPSTNAPTAKPGPLDIPNTLAHPDSVSAVENGVVLLWFQLHANFES